MKSKFYLFAIVLSFVFVSCDEAENPEEIIEVTACFDYTPKTDIEEGTEISFTNCSENALVAGWSFGDGSISTDENPVHAYDEVGEYIVQLIVSNATDVDTISHTITVNEPNNSFIYNEKLYELSTGYYFLYEDGSFNLLLHSSGITFNNDGIQAFSGNGHLIIFELNLGPVDNTNDLPTGQFTITEDGDNYIVLGADYSTEQFESVEYFSNGELTISNGVNGGYTVLYEGSVDNGKALELYFSGEIQKQE